MDKLKLIVCLIALGSSYSSETAFAGAYYAGCGYPPLLNPVSCPNGHWTCISDESGKTTWILIGCES